MTTARITMVEELNQFIEQYADSPHCLELFRFFGEYPHARFSKLAVVHALNSEQGESSIRKALKQLVDRGVIRMSVNNNISLYSMAEDESLRSLASKLAKLDWGQWQLMLRQTLPISVK